MTEEKISKIGNALLTSVKKDCKSDVSISFSGGIDSTLVALLAKKYTNVELIAVGIKDSHDIEAAKSAAKLIDLTLNVKEINEDELNVPISGTDFGKIEDKTINTNVILIKINHMKLESK